jgi:hypothetical protein
MKSCTRLLFTIVLACASVVPVVEAAVPQAIPYQGRLTDSAGAPLNGTFSIRFSLHTAATAGSELWFETQNVTVANGLFNVNLGTVTAFPSTLFSGNELFLQIQVASDPAMTPRQRMGSVAYAMRSGLSPGVAMARLTTDFTITSTTTLQTVLTRAISVPGPGVVIVEASGQPRFSGTTSGNQICFQVDDNTSTSLDFTAHHCVGFSTTSPSGTTFIPASIVRAFNVTSAGTITYRFKALKITATGDVAIWQPSLVVTYYPDALGTVTTEPSFETHEDQVGPGGHR